MSSVVQVLAFAGVRPFVRYKLKLSARVRILFNLFETPICPEPVEMLAKIYPIETIAGDFLKSLSLIKKYFVLQRNSWFLFTGSSPRVFPASRSYSAQPVMLIIKAKAPYIWE